MSAKGKRQEKKGRGRPPVQDQDRILKNGFLARQWKEIQKEAKSRGVSAGHIQREIVEWFFAAKLAATQTPVVLPEQDHEFEELVSGNQIPKSTKSTKEN